MKGGINMTTHWCILRTAPARTLPLADKLMKAGIEAWSPRYVLTKQGKEREIAILPTFVFARAEWLGEIVKLLRLPVNSYPQFSIFRTTARYPLIADREIANLRDAEARAQIKSRRSKRRALVMGQRVKGWGIFSGMTGEVIRINKSGKIAMIAFDGLLNVEIEAWQMPEEVVNDHASGLSAVA